MTIKIQVKVFKKQTFVGWREFGRKTIETSLKTIDRSRIRQLASDFACKIACMPRAPKWTIVGNTHILIDNGPLCDKNGNPAENHSIEIRLTK